MRHQRYSSARSVMSACLIRSVQTATNIALAQLPSGAYRSKESQVALFLGVLEAAVRDVDPALADRVRLVATDRSTPAAGA